MREESFTAVASSGAEKKGIAVSEECSEPSASRELCLCLSIIPFTIYYILLSRNYLALIHIIMRRTDSGQCSSKS